MIQSSVTVKVVRMDMGWSLLLTQDGVERGVYGWYDSPESANRAAQAVFAVMEAALKATVVS